MEKYCISIDWLQVYCLCNISERLPEHIHLNCGIDCCVVKQGLQTSIWTEVYEINSAQHNVATFYRGNRTKQGDKGCTLKINNRYLYSSICMQVLTDICTELHLIYQGITRLDLCYDCNLLHDGLSVPDFLYDYICAPAYQSGHIVRVGSRKVAMHATRTTNGVLSINSMRWGSQASAIGAYCYNKSLELLEVKNKPWIVERWESVGLVHSLRAEDWAKLTEKKKEAAIEYGDSIDYVSQSVWRFEISIKAKGFDLLNTTSGELFRLSTDFLQTQGRIEELFYIYAKKAFCFRRSAGQQLVRNYPELQIFEYSQKSAVKPISLNHFKDTGRAEKVARNTLAKCYAKYGDLSLEKRESIESAITLLSEISGLKSSISNMQARELIRREQRKLKPRDVENISWLWRDYVDMAQILGASKIQDVDDDLLFFYYQSLYEECERMDASDKAFEHVNDNYGGDLPAPLLQDFLYY